VPVGRPLWKERSSWYLVAERDHIIPAETQNFMAQRMNAKVVSHPVDHMPMMTAPDVVVQVLSDVVDSVA
jgi:pimeloyl-ACP methyl ester carboxylesterase